MPEYRQEAGTRPGDSRLVADGWKLAVAVVRVALGVGLLFWVLSRSALQAMAPVVSNAWILFVLLALAIFGVTVEAERLRILFRSAGLGLPRPLAYRVVPVGTFFNFCVPGGTGGDVVKLYYLARANPGVGVEVATVVVVDRVIALTAVLLLVLGLAVPSVGLVRSSSILQAVVLTAMAMLGAIAIVLLLAWSRAFRATRVYGALMRRAPFHRYVERIADAVHAFRDRKRALLAALFVSFFGHMGVAATYVAVASVILPSVQWPVVSFLSMLGMVANAVPITPGGLGVGEAAFEQLFRVSGATGGAALLVLWRLSMIPIAIVGATLYITGRIRTAPPAVETAPATAERTA